MKTLLITLAAFAVLFITGCQENSVTDPLTVDAVNKDKNPDTYLHGFIPLERVLDDPYPIGNSFYKISGEIEFDHRLLPQNPNLSPSQRYVSLHFSTNADISYFCTVCSPSEEDELAGFISDNSEEYLLITGSFIIIEKSFPIQGREDGMDLVCKFKVSAYDVELKEMWLSLEETPINRSNKHSVPGDTVTYPPIRIYVVQ